MILLVINTKKVYIENVLSGKEKVSGRGKGKYKFKK